MSRLDRLVREMAPFIEGIPSTVTEDGIDPVIPASLGIVEPGQVGDAMNYLKFFTQSFNQGTGLEDTKFLGSDIHTELRYMWQFPQKEILTAFGTFDQKGEFQAPIKVWKVGEFTKEEGENFYILGQLGNFQLITAEPQLIEKGKIKIFRGLKYNTHYQHPAIEGEAKKVYNDHVAKSFLWPALTFALAGKSARTETNHVNDLLLYDTIRKSGTEITAKTGIFGEQSYSTIKKISTQKFGPCYVSMTTALQNIRLFPDLACENEVVLINHDKVEDIQAHVGPDPCYLKG